MIGIFQIFTAYERIVFAGRYTAGKWTVTRPPRIDNLSNLATQPSSNETSAMSWQSRMRLKLKLDDHPDSLERFANSRHAYSFELIEELSAGKNRPSTFKTEDLVGFLHQLQPRVVPDALRVQFKPDTFLLFFGVIFFLFGLGNFILGCSIRFPMEDDGTELPVWVMPAVGGLVMSIGAFIYGLPKWLAWRKLQLLRRGRLIDGKIISCKPSLYFVNNQRLFNVGFQASDGTKTSTLMLRATATKANQLMQNGSNTPALQDPVKPSRVVLVECYTLD